MAFLNWKTDYSVGVKVFDDQHQTLFRLINDFITAIKQGREHEHTSRTLQGLMDYAATHFKAEETLMRQYDYPAFDEHKAAHDRFAATVTDLLRQTAEERMEHPPLSRFLMDWLVQHILGADRAYSAFFRERGVT